MSGPTRQSISSGCSARLCAGSSTPGRQSKPRTQRGCGGVSRPARTPRRGPDLVIRLGGTPTSKVMNAWLAAAAAPTFLIDPDRMWRDEDQVASNVLVCDPQPLVEIGR